jgi:hypothetical protein
MTEPTNSVELAQAKLNRAVSAWANHPHASLQDRAVDRELQAAANTFRDACQRAFNNATQAAPEYIVPEAPMARELRIANLLAVASHPIPLGVDAANRIRKDAHWQALKLLGLVD